MALPKDFLNCSLYTAAKKQKSEKNTFFFAKAVKIKGTSGNSYSIPKIDLSCYTTKSPEDINLKDPVSRISGGSIFSFKEQLTREKQKGC